MRKEEHNMNKPTFENFKEITKQMVAEGVSTEELSYIKSKIRDLVYCELQGKYNSPEEAYSYMLGTLENARDSFELCWQVYSHFWMGIKVGAEDVDLVKTAGLLSERLYEASLACIQAAGIIDKISGGFMRYGEDDS